MTPTIPEQPLRFIKECLSSGRIRWTYHVSMRLRQRSLRGEMLVEGAESLEILESYPNDKYLPSYLLRGDNRGRIFHAQVAVDVADENIRVVTMYEPSLEEWDSEFRIRRGQA